MNDSANPEKIAVFGFKDSLVGQVLELLKFDMKYEVVYFISVNGLPSIDVDIEHQKRPNRKTEFVQHGRLFDRPVFSSPNYIEKLLADEIKMVLVLEDNICLRSEIFKSIYEVNIQPISYIHSSTFLSGQNTIGEGVIIFPNCYIGYKSDIGHGTIIQSNSVIEHHNVVGNFCNINPRLTTGGFTYIGNFVEINMSVDIINRIRIEDGARIGAGSLVLDNCQEKMLYYGRPARKIRPNLGLSTTNS